MIRTILSQNTTDAQSGAAARALEARFPDPAEILRADPAVIEETIRSCGLAGQKTRTILGFLGWLERRGGSGGAGRDTLPMAFLEEMDTCEAEALLLNVPGVGRKTARCVLLFHCGRDIFPMDTHVARVSGRLGLIPDGASSDQAHRALDDLVPSGSCLSLHLNMVRLGREVCRPGRPACGECPLAAICPSAVSPLSLL